MKSYVFKIVVEQDEERWFAYCPALRKYGATTWGYTKEEAYKNIKEVVEMVIDELVEDKEPIPEDPKEEVEIFFDPRVLVNV